MRTMTEDQRTFFENNGYLVIEGSLSPKSLR